MPLDPTALPKAKARQQYVATTTDAYGATAPAGAMYHPEASAVPVIIDTDWWTDTSDVTGLRVATSLERMGKLDIRAVVINCTFATSVPSVDALMYNDGHRWCPIGKSSTSHVPDGSPPFQSGMHQNYPHDLGLEDQAPSALTVMRQVLEDADRPVDIVAIGYCNNLADLMNSPADAISDLTGMEMIEQKVGTLWCISGAYPTGSENNFNRTELAKTTAADVCANWPGPLIFMGFEVGEYIMSGGQLRSTNTSDPVAVALVDQGNQYGRPSWDGLGIYACAYGVTASGYTLVRGTNVVSASTGANTFTPSANGPHYYMVKAESDQYYAEQMAPLIYATATADDSETGVQVWRDGMWQAADASKRALGSVSARAFGSDETLVAHWHAADLAGWNDGSAMAHWPDRTGRYTARQTATSANRPLFRTSVGGRAAVTFDGSNDSMVTDFLAASPRDWTVYALVYFASVPSAQQTIFSLDSLSLGGLYPPKAGRLVINSSGKPAGLRFANITGYTDTAASAISGTTWTNVAMRFSKTTQKVEVLVNGTGTGGTSIGAASYANSGLYVPMTIGGRYYDASNVEMLNGSIRELRFYNVGHSDVQVAAVVAAMA